MMWRLNRREQIALGCVVVLAARPARFCKSNDLAQAVGSSKAFVEQALLPLRRAGLLRARRGPQGGVQLAQSPEQVSVLQVLQVLQALARKAPRAHEPSTQAAAASAWVVEVGEAALAARLAELSLAALCAEVDRDAAARALSALSFEI